MRSPLNMIDYTEQLLAAYSRLPEQLETARRSSKRRTTDPEVQGQEAEE